MRFCAMAFSMVVLTCSWLTTSRKDWGRYLRAITWYMGWVSGTHRTSNARLRVIRGTRTAPLPLLPSGPGGVCGRPLHGARNLTSFIVASPLPYNRRVRLLSLLLVSLCLASCQRGGQNNDEAVRQGIL